MKRSNRLYTFDIFDTCVTRSCGTPDNVFFLLAQRVCTSRDNSVLRGFVCERLMAEKLAEQRYQNKAVSIDEIYSVADFSLFSSIPNSAIKHEEMAIERMCLYPVEQTISLISECREKGNIAFISDMYLPSSFLREILKKYGIYKENDAIYVSCDYGATKRIGNLFDRVKKDYKKSKWVHFGDNLFSDYLIPRKKGIKAHLVKTPFSDYENKWITDSCFTPAGKNQSLFAGIMRSIRLSTNSDNALFVTNIMIPLLITFTVSVIEDAKRRGIRTLFFASRDTYGMYKVAQELIKNEDNIEVKYIHISTKVLYPCLITNGTAEELHNILTFMGVFKPRKILNMFGFSEHEISLIAKQFDIDRELSVKDPSLETFINLILSVEYCHGLLERCRNKRHLLMHYLSQESLCDKYQKVGLVDIGWRLTSQAIINKILPDNNIFYYYYGVSPSRLNIKKTGFFLSMSFWEDFRKVNSDNKFIEYYICRANEGSTIGYRLNDERKIEPITETINLKDRNRKDILNNIDLLIQAARQYSYIMRYSTDAQGLFYAVSMKTTILFCKKPKQKMLKGLAPYLFVEHYSKESPVIIKLFPWTIIYIVTLYVFKNIHRNVSSILRRYKTVWFIGSIIYTYGPLGYLISTIWWHLQESTFFKNFIKKFLFIFNKIK